MSLWVLAFAIGLAHSSPLLAEDTSLGFWDNVIGQSRSRFVKLCRDVHDGRLQTDDGTLICMIGDDEVAIYASFGGESRAFGWMMMHRKPAVAGSMLRFLLDSFDLPDREGQNMGNGCFGDSWYDRDGLDFTYIKCENGLYMLKVGRS